jgi:hypothetical protein
MAAKSGRLARQMKLGEVPPLKAQRCRDGTDNGLLGKAQQ